MKKKPRILLIDDDPVFGHLMFLTAQRFNVSLQFIASTGELYKTPPAAFDMVIIDYDLETVTGIQLAQLLFDEAPVLLVSAYKGVRARILDTRSERRFWFCNKAVGPENILKEAVNCYAAWHSPE